MSVARTLGRWFRPETAWTRQETRSRRAALAVLDDSLAATPQGGAIRALGLEALLDAHANLIGRIRIAFGGEEGAFERVLLPTIRRFAAFVHLLPATRDAHFRYPGGLLRCGLEVGLHALQAADAQVFPGGATVQARRAAAPRWRAAAFVTGLCSEVHRPLFGASVHCDVGGPWIPLLMPLVDWLERRRCEHYIVRWREELPAPRAATLVFLPQILAPTLVSFLAEPERAILDQVVCAFAIPADGRQYAIGSIVEEILARVLVRDLNRDTAAPLPMAAIPEIAETTPRDEPPPAESGRVPDSGSAVCLASALPPETEVAEYNADPPTVERAPVPETGEKVRPPVEPARAPPPVAPRALAIPPTLHPGVAEALAALLKSPIDAPIDVSNKGIFVPLALFAQRGLDTGLVVGALHEARLLVLQGNRKVWRGRGRDPDLPGVMLCPRLLS